MCRAITIVQYYGSGLHFFIATDNHLSLIRFDLQRFPHDLNNCLIRIGAFIAGFGTWLDRHSQVEVEILTPTEFVDQIAGSPRTARELIQRLIIIPRTRRQRRISCAGFSTSQQGFSVGPTKMWHNDKLWQIDPVMAPYRVAAVSGRFAG
jgi:hypothetical protein